MGGVAVVFEVQEGPLVPYKVAKPAMVKSHTQHTDGDTRTYTPTPPHTHTHTPSFIIAAPWSHSVLATILISLKLCLCFL